MSAPSHRPVRWPLLFALLALGGTTFAVNALVPGDNHQRQVFRAMFILLVSAGLVFVWVLALSRLPWRARLGTVATLLLAGSIFAMGFRLKEVTGDMRPVFEWRWKQARVLQSAPDAGTNITPAAAAAPDAGDFPQFLGPQRNGILAGPMLARDWAASPPKVLWRQPVGAAWSGFAVSGARAVTQEQRGGEECVVGYDLGTGRPLWAHRDRARYYTKVAGEGPRATPTIQGGRVFALGATGLLNCLDLETGALVWSRNIATDNDTSTPDFGYCGSPLLHGDAVIVCAGGGRNRSLVAYHRDTGARLWAGGSEAAGYSSPMLSEIAGVRQILVFNHSAAAHDAATGRVLWTHPWRGGHPHVMTPLALPEDRVLVSSGYGTGAELLRVGRSASNELVVTSLWKARSPKAKFTNLIPHGGYIYGLDDGILCCVEIATGALKWKDGRYGHGQLLLVGDTLLVMAESGDVALVEPTPEGLHEWTRFAALPGKTWNPPALAGDLLLVRNPEEAACLRLPER